MTPVQISKTGTGRSAIVNLDNMTNPYNVGFHYVVTGTATFSIELTPEDPFDATPTIWNAPSGMSALSASGVQNSTIPSRGVSINVASGTGTVTLYIVQAGLR